MWHSRVSVARKLCPRIQKRSNFEPSRPVGRTRRVATTPMSTKHGMISQANRISGCPSNFTRRHSKHDGGHLSATRPCLKAGSVPRFLSIRPSFFFSPFLQSVCVSSPLYCLCLPLTRLQWFLLSVCNSSVHSSSPLHWVSTRKTILKDNTASLTIETSVDLV